MNIGNSETNRKCGDGNVRKGRLLQWDEETIAEHDKERGTRQKIDEPPTPYRYSSASESEMSDGGESEHNDDIGSANARWRSPSIDGILPPGCLDVNNISHVSGKMQIAGNSGNNSSNDSSPIRPSIHNSHHLQPRQQQPQNVMEGNSWEDLQAKLQYHQQLQQSNDAAIAAVAAGGSRGGSNSMVSDELGRGREVGFGEGGGGGRSRGVFLFGNQPDNGSRGNSEGGGGGEDKAGFRDKRSAHYNEFLMVKAMRAKMAAEADEDDDDDDEGKDASGNGSGHGDIYHSSSKKISNGDDDHENDADNERDD